MAMGPSRFEECKNARSLLVLNNAYKIESIDPWWAQGYAGGIFSAYSVLVRSSSVNIIYNDSPAGEGLRDQYCINYCVHVERDSSKMYQGVLPKQLRVSS
jgi:hypothetical protein